MELTNYSFLQSRNDYLQSSAEMKVSSDRLSSGNRLVSGMKDVELLALTQIYGPPASIIGQKRLIYKISIASCRLNQML